MLDSRRVIEILHELGSSAMLGALFAHGALLGAAAVSEPPAYAAIAAAIRSEVAHEWARLGILLLLIFVNVVLSVWRPKLRQKKPTADSRQFQLSASPLTAGSRSRRSG